MGNYIEELIKTSNTHLEYFDKIKEDELKNKVFEEIKEKMLKKTKVRVKDNKNRKNGKI